MKLSKIILLLLLVIQPVIVSKPTQAGESEELYNLCAKSPYNSRCKDYVAPVALKNRTGENARCLIDAEEKASDCKVTLEDEQLLLYVEIGDSLSVLEGEKDTKEVVVPLKLIQSLSYSEDSKVDIGSVLAFGVLGLLDKKEISTFNISFQEEEEKPLQRMTVVLDRKIGREMRQQLQQKNGLTVEILNVE